MSAAGATERWPRVEEVLGAALERTASERNAFLEAECAGDPALRREVESLLAAAAGAGTFDALVASVAPLTARLHEPPTALLAGGAVGRYQVLGFVAGGGMGVVQRAWDERLGRTVALKFLHPRFGADAEAAERFRQEARAVAALEHPNICTVHEIGETEDGQLYLAMPLYDGETLQQRVARGPLDVTEAVGIAVQMARGLAKAHARGIVHRDVKPSNVFVTEDGVVKLLDFGIAALAGSAGVAAGPLGTIAYMSPEQVRNEPVDPRTDVWSLGVVLYEMLTGERPFRGATAAAIAAAIQRAAPAPLHTRRPGVAAPLECAVMRALATSPDARHPSARAMECELLAVSAAVEALAGVPLAATPRPDAPAGGTRARALRPAMLATCVAALVLVMLVGWGGATSPRAAWPATASVGVLPFVNMSPDPANGYLGDGLAGEVIASLGRVEGLRVAARTSSFALRDGRLDARAIGDTLGVEAVLEGSVRRDAGRIRITAQLVDVATGYRIWSDEFDRAPQDVLGLREEIAAAIARALERRHASTRAQVRPDFKTYELYLRGLHQRDRLTPDGLRQASALFDAAIAREPAFAAAYAAKASVVGPLMMFGHLPQSEGVPVLRALTARALALDPGLGEAHAALGMQRLFFDWDWAGAERTLRRAIALNPSDAHAHHHLANYLRAMGRLDEAVASRARAVALDPLNPRTVVVLGVDHFVAGAMDSAMTHFRRAHQLDPAHALALGSGPFLPVGPGEVYERQRRYAEAVEEYVRIARLRGATARDVERLRGGYARGGMPGLWRRWLEMERGGSSEPPDPFRMAHLSVRVGDTAQAVRWLERAYAARHPALVYLRSTPAFAPLHGDPRVARILTAMRFPTRAHTAAPTSPDTSEAPAPHARPLRAIRR